MKIKKKKCAFVKITILKLQECRQLTMSVNCLHSIQKSLNSMTLLLNSNVIDNNRMGSEESRDCSIKNKTASKVLT